MTEQEHRIKLLEKTLSDRESKWAKLLSECRHQVCEEIREKMCCIYDYKNDEYLNGWNDAMHTVYDKLDQIEGESK